MPKKTKPRAGKKVAKSAEYKVGRGKPPKHTQFEKGETGNAGGRPKGRKNLATILKEAARNQVTATIGGKTRKISSLQATALQMATQAAGGKGPMVAKFLDWIDEIESRAAAARPVQFPFSGADLEVLRAIFDRMKQCEPNEARE